MPYSLAFRYAVALPIPKSLAARTMLPVWNTTVASARFSRSMKLRVSGAGAGVDAAVRIGKADLDRFKLCFCDAFGFEEFCREAPLMKNLQLNSISQLSLSIYLHPLGQCRGPQSSSRDQASGSE